MSFGFGSGNTGSTFGGFGSNNNNTNTSGGSLFGSNTSTTGGGFGGSTGGFGGGNASNPFGQSQNKTGFGSPATTSSGGMFGGAGTSTTGGFGGGTTGGFGSNNNTASTGFGGTNTSGGGLFGQNKPATGGFGSSAAAPSGGGLFGSSNTGGGFGSNNTTTQNNPFGGSTTGTTNPFGGGSTNTGFGANNTTTNNAGSGGFAFGGGNTNAASTTQGTAGTPFTPFSEKDGAAGQTSSYQSITMQQPYQNKSFEELRVEDYMQNRRLPQSGSFGAGATGGSTFGGFGQSTSTPAPATGGGLFGGGNTGTTGFGASNTTNTGFGANNTSTTSGFGGGNAGGGGLFGAPKPATGGGLFGNNAASSGTATGGFGATSGSGGGLFGNNNTQTNTTGGFGNSTGGFGAGATNNTTGGGLFGAQNNQTQNKPAFGGFGASTNTGSTGTGFGQTNNTQQPQQGGGLFGGGASNTGSSLFGGQQNKPAGGGLFGGGNTGTTNTGGGLFGGGANNTNTQQNTGFGQSTNNTGGGLFGANNNNNQSTNTGGGLFGNSQNKPASGGLFGNSTTGGASGGLFGNNNNQQQNSTTGGSLFGNNNNQQQNTGGSLFGGQQNKPAGGGLFGGSTGGTGSLFGNNNNNQSQNQGNSLFGGNNNNQGGGNSLFGGNNQSQNQNAGSSLFGNSQQQQPQQNQLTATLTGDPYGNAQLFSSLAAPSPPVGPLATPLSGAKAPQRPRTSLLSSVRGGTPMLGASQTMTPRTRPGYGFSYSTYNSPGSGSQTLTPGAAGLLRPTSSLGSSLSGRLSKSFSTSNLRGDAAPEGQSLLRTPAAGQSSLLIGNGSGSLGSGRKLKIDRSLRTDLFGDNTPKQKQVEAAKSQEPGLRKRVSFDRNAEDNVAQPSAANSLVVREDEDTTPTGTPEPKRVNGNGLDSVPEESNTPKAAPAASPKSRVITEGSYWTSPSMKQLQNMSRQQLQNINTLTVGRENIGQIEFGRDGSLDLSTVPLARICGDFVRLEHRHATVYKDDHEKPPMGEGLNVPSTISLEQCWPKSSRASSATPQTKEATDRLIARYKRGLAKMKDTTFVEYNAETGVWTFNVEHFTTYGLDESDDEDDFEDGTDMMDLQPKVPASMQNATNGEPSAASKTQRSAESDDSDMDSPGLGEPDDTFEFKLSRRSQQDDLTVPGGFEDMNGTPKLAFTQVVAPDNSTYDEHIMSGGLGESYMDDPFIEAGGAVQEPSAAALERYHSSLMEDDEESEQDVPGSFHAEPLPPRSILKPTANFQNFASPEKVAELPWEEQLQRTMSPKKRDRQALRDMQGSLKRAQPAGGYIESPLKKSLFSRSQLGQSHLATKSAQKNPTGFGVSTMGRDSDLGKSQAFTTGMDLINSLWGQPQKESKAQESSAEMPYPSKRRRVSASNMNDNDAAFHDSFKPSFDGQNALVYSVPGSAPQLSGDMKQVIKPLVSEGRDIRFAKFAALEDIDSQTLELQKNHTELLTSDEQAEVPRAIAPAEIAFAALAQVDTGSSALAVQEKAIWELSSILFDSLDVCAGDLLEGMSDEQIAEYEPRIRLDRFQSFWSDLLAPIVDSHVKTTRSVEEKAILLLTKGDVITACQVLMDAGDVKLATLVAQLPGSETSREVMKQQIQMWQERKDWSEFSDAHKALYSIIAGETCVVSGLTGAPEDRTQQFNLSERFSLDWRQSLALCAHYGGHENIVQTVSAYIGNLRDGKETVKPLPINGSDAGENTLLGLLRLYALKEAQVERLFDSATVSGSAVDSRLAWQLATVLEAKDLCDFPEEKMDALTLDFASQLESAGAWTKAAWTLLHLSENDARTTAIRGLLERSAAQLPSPDLDQDNTLMEDDSGWSLTGIQIPTSLIWEAKAIYAHAVLREPALQAKWLLYTQTDEAFAEAHDVLCSTVGPRAVIEKDYADLKDLLECFNTHGAQEFADWKHGGKIYADFVRLNELSEAKKHGRDGRNTCWVLRKGLEGAQQDEGGKSLEVRVATGEIFRVLGDVEREIGVNPKFNFDGMDVDPEVRGGVKGMLDGYMKAIGIVV